MSIDITRIEINIPKKGRFFLVEKESDDEFLDDFEGDKEAIDFLYELFEKAEKEGLTYSYADHARIVTRKVTRENIFNCDAIRDVLAHNGIKLPDDFPTASSRFIGLNALDGIDVDF